MGTRAGCIVAIAAWGTLAGSAAAQCPPSPAPLPASPSPATERYVERYNTLLAGDPRLYSGTMAPGWRVLRDDLTRDASVPDELKAWTAIMLAGSLHEDGETAEALDIAGSALRLAGTNAPVATPLRAEVMTLLALKEVNAGRIADAVTHADQAVADTRKLYGDQSWAYGRALASAGSAANAVGRYEDAERDFATAEKLAVACLPADAPHVELMIKNHAAMLGTLGRLDESLAEVERALAWLTAYGREDGAELSTLLSTYGWTLRNAGRLREAEAVLRRSVDLYARFEPDDWSSRANTVGKLANVLAVEGRYVEAEALWLTAHDYHLKAHNLSNPLGGSGELRRSADAAQLRGDLPLALARRRAAVDLMAARVQPQHPELMRARLEFASTLSLMGRLPEAMAMARPAIDILRSSMADADFKRWGAEITYAQIVAGGGDAPAADAIAAPALAWMERALFDAATSRGNLVTFAPAFSGSFATGARLALLTGHAEAAFHDLQLANLSDIVLVNADIAQRAAAANAPARALVDRLQQRTRDRRRLDHDRALAASRRDEAGVRTAQAAIQAADGEIAAASAELDRVFPAFRAIGRPTPVTLAAYRARLGPDDILLAPVSQTGGSFTIAVTREGLVWAPLPASPARIADLVARIRRSIDASRAGEHRFDRAAARDLYAAIVPPALEPTLRRHHHLLYYATGALATIPPALLVAAPLRTGAATPWLIRSHRISVVLSLTAAANNPTRARMTFLGVGAPASGKAVKPAATSGTDLRRSAFPALAPLPGARRELTAMAAMFPPDHDRLLLGDRATKPALRALPLDRYRVIAFATHGLLSDAVPGLTEPALMLTPSGGDHGLLTASDVANLRLDADWVILSACDTASGSDAQSASYSGLARAFMEAGTRALLVSHWPVRDDAARQLTVATLRGTRRGLDRPAALRRAMIALMDDRRVPGSGDPAIWAPFVVVER